MDYFVDFRPSEYTNFKKNCRYFRQHYIFLEDQKVFEKIPVGHCSLSSRLNCNGCKKCVYKDFESNAERYASQKVILKNLEEHVEWVEDIIKNFFEDDE